MAESEAGGASPSSMASVARELLAGSAKVQLFAMLRRTLKPDEMPALLRAHLTWMIEQEGQGRIFLSGPTARRDGFDRLDGLTIIRADDLAGAERLAAQDPFVIAGVVGFEIYPWIVNEGALSFTLTLSNSKVAL